MGRSPFYFVYTGLYLESQASLLGHIVCHLAAHAFKFGSTEQSHLCPEKPHLGRPHFRCSKNGSFFFGEGGVNFEKLIGRVLATLSF
jgi:hypothetical protein